MKRARKPAPGDGRRLFLELVTRKCLKDRLNPVLEMAAGMIDGRSVQGTQAHCLPEYCHRLARIIRNNGLSVLRGPAEVMSYDPEKLAACTTPEAARAEVKVDWEAYGVLLGVLKRLIHEAESDHGSDAGTVDLAMLRFLYGAALDQVTEADVDRAVAKLRQLLAHGLKHAAQWGPQAVAAVHRGMAAGLIGLVDEDFQIVHTTPRENIYDFLAIVWPEIQEMQNAVPPKSRRDLYNWLQPFVRDGIVSLVDYDQLCDVCDEIGLKMKGRGRPRKLR